MLVELVLVALLLLLLYKWNQDPPGLPPGPRRYPVIGCFPAHTTEQLRALQEKYGDIVWSCVGQQNMVHLFNYKTVRELFSKTEFSDRPDWEALHYLSDGQQKGVVFSNGDQWQHSRRFFLKHLKDMGMGKSYLDDAILQEAKALVEDFHNYTDRPTHLPSSSIKVAVLNVIWQLVASRRYGLHDEELIKFMGTIRTFQKYLPLMILPEFFSWLRYIPRSLYKRLFKFGWMDEAAKVAEDMMKKEVEDHRTKLDSSNPRDVIDAYLLEMEAQKDNPDSLFDEVDMIRGIFDLFAAGFDTTSNILHWVCIFMADNPKVQKRIQEEIDEVVDRGTLPSHHHRSRLIYLDATLHEVHRASSVVPSGVPHTVNCDVRIEGYNIPKGTIINSCHAVIHSDTRYWDNPEEFRPERFLDESGNLAPKREGFLPFGVGKRSCLGEALARMELYLFSAALLQNFSFAPPENTKVDMGIQIFGGQNLPIDQNLIITSRK